MKKEKLDFTRSMNLKRNEEQKKSKKPDKPVKGWKELYKKWESLNIRKSFGRQEKFYHESVSVGSMGIGQRILAFGQGACAAGAVAYTFYRSLAVFGILLIFAGIYPWFYEKTWQEKQLCRLEKQFKEAIQILSGFLSAGYSAENAVSASSRELEQLYGVQGMIVKEFQYMAVQINMNRTVEEAMQEFADRSGLEEAERFSQIFKIAKRSGGQLVPVICHTVSVMEDRSQVKEEIRTMTASVRFEQKVMNVIPFLMILYIDMTSPGFFQVMYETMLGRMIMTICLAVYLLSCYLSRKFLDIRIG